LMSNSKRGNILDIHHRKRRYHSLTFILYLISDRTSLFFISIWRINK
jgi:hypothetical protein